MKRNALRRRILSKYNRLDDFAAACGVSNITISNIVSGRSFPREELTKTIITLLDIQQEEVGGLFFPEFDE